MSNLKKNGQQMNTGESIGATNLRGSEEEPDLLSVTDSGDEQELGSCLET